MSTMNIFNITSQRLTAAVFAALILLTAASADAPGRVARLAEFVGDVQLANEREDWRPISRNYAITAADNLYVSEGGRAELDVGSVQLWLTGGTNIYFERFDDQSIVARISQGEMAVRIRASDQQDSLRVLAQSGEISLLQPGFYVVSAASSDEPAAVTRQKYLPMAAPLSSIAAIICCSTPTALVSIDTPQAPAAVALKLGQGLVIAAMTVTPTATAVAAINGWLAQRISINMAIGITTTSMVVSGIQPR